MDALCEGQFNQDELDDIADRVDFSSNKLRSVFMEFMLGDRSVEEDGLDDDDDAADCAREIGEAVERGDRTPLEKSTNDSNEFWYKQIFTHSNELCFLIQMTYFAQIGIQNFKMNLFQFISQPFSHGFSFTMAHFEAQNMLDPTFKYIRIFE